MNGVRRGDVTMLLAEVVVDVRTKALDRPFDYAVDPPLTNTLRPGHRVRVPFGQGLSQGYVLSLRSVGPNDPSIEGIRLRGVHSILDKEPVLTGELLKLVDWLCYRYVCTRLEAIEAILPSVFRHGKDVAPTQVMVLRSELNKEALMELADAKEKRAPKQSALLKRLAQSGEVHFSTSEIRPSDPSVKAILEAGYAEIKSVDQFQEVAAASWTEAAVASDRILTPYQAKALTAVHQAMKDEQPRTLIMNGVTGSGKTEVYLQAIATCLEQGGSAIVLVPEISLTPQMVGRFTARFGREVAVLHSRLNAGERKDEWIRLRRREARIAVGARSAIFAPLEHPQLIIIDEEHETSYKQEETPRYDAREVAEWRARAACGTVVMGSATPSLTAMHRVANGAATLVTLPNRVNGQPLPPVEIVDMREELRQGNRHLFSLSLQTGLEAAINGGEQAILFLNRRGFAAFVLCRNCGDVLECPHCDISLTLHRHGQRMWMTCHYCQHTEPFPEVCPACSDPGLRAFGVGTQQVEQAIHERWPQWRVLRMDVDTTRRKDAHQSALQAFQDGQADVLVGTQMVAKGLDFPRVTFVGVVAADTMLSVPDYRSAERTFNLLTQVAGRAGRADKPGRTVVQTFRPEHYAVLSAARHDYSSFYRQETEYRSMFEYPPFCELTTFVAVHSEESYAQGAAKRYERELRRRLPESEVNILPASPSSLARVEDLYRYQVVLKYSAWDDVREAVVAAYHLVYDKLHRLGGYGVLDVNAGRM